MTLIIFSKEKPLIMSNWQKLNQESKPNKLQKKLHLQKKQRNSLNGMVFFTMLTAKDTFQTDSLLTEPIISSKPTPQPR